MFIKIVKYHLIMHKTVQRTTSSHTICITNTNMAITFCTVKGLKKVKITSLTTLKLHARIVSQICDLAIMHGLLTNVYNMTRE